jgi:hypothetical protein
MWMVTRSCSITVHPLGFVLTKFLHPGENATPAELEFTQQIHVKKVLALKKYVSDWIAWLEDGI